MTKMEVHKRHISTGEYDGNCKYSGKRRYGTLTAQAANVSKFFGNSCTVFQALNSLDILKVDFTDNLSKT